jgi:hypothetical protein
LRVSSRQNPTKEDFASEAEAVFGRADRGGAKAGRGGVQVAELTFDKVMLQDVLAAKKL